MGEKIEMKNEGEKNAAAPAAEGVEKAAAGGGGEQKEAPMLVVLKMDLHCQGCAKKVRRSVSNLQGVETVKADCDAKKLIVTGNVDPTWLREKVEIKTKKKVELLSPPPKKDGGAAAPAAEKKGDEPKADEAKKPIKAVVSTVTMKTKLHCDGCAHKVKRIIIKNFDGVDSITTDLQKDLIIVTGTMNVNDLVTYLREKVKRGVEIVPPKKDDGAAAVEKKPAEGAAADGKEKPSGGGGEHEKKGKESVVEVGAAQKEAGGDKGKKEAESKPEGAPAAAVGGGETKFEMSKMEYHGSYNPQTHYAMPMVMQNQSYGHQDYYGMHHQQSHMNMGYYPAAAPPMPPPTYLDANANDNVFSDENPNGCSVM